LSRKSCSSNSRRRQRPRAVYAVQRHRLLSIANPTLPDGPSLGRARRPYRADGAKIPLPGSEFPIHQCGMQQTFNPAQKLHQFLSSGLPLAARSALTSACSRPPPASAHASLWHTAPRRDVALQRARAHASPSHAATARAARTGSRTRTRTRGPRATRARRVRRHPGHVEVHVRLAATDSRRRRQVVTSDGAHSYSRAEAIMGGRLSDAARLSRPPRSGAGPWAWPAVLSKSERAATSRPFHCAGAFFAAGPRAYCFQ
jgi:hypothetical protein